MSKNYANYVGVNTSGNFKSRRKHVGIINFFDQILNVGSFSASGGNEVLDSGDYTLHIFTSPGTFEVLDGSITIEYLVIAGGGGGGNPNPSPLAQGGGGGAGGLLNSSALISKGVYNITVGSGGAVSALGNPSSIQNIATATGGGVGGGWRSGGSSGGSGGGGGANSPTYDTGGGPSGGAGTPGQGNPGGPGQNLGSTGGGGGGKSSAGVLGGGGNGIAISWVPPSYGTTGPTPGRWFAGGGPNGLGRSGQGGGGSAGGSGNAGLVIIRYLI